MAGGLGYIPIAPLTYEEIAQQDLLRKQDEERSAIRAVLSQAKREHRDLQSMQEAIWRRQDELEARILEVEQNIDQAVRIRLKSLMESL